MRNRFILFLLSILLMVGIVSAQCMIPMPLLVSTPSFATGTVIEAREIVSTGTILEDSISCTLTSDQNCVLSLSNIGVCELGKQVEVKIKGCVEDYCKATIIMDEQVMRYSFQDLGEVHTEYVEKIIEPNCPPEKICEEKDCLDDGYSWLAILLGIVLTMAGGVSVWKFYLNDKIFTGVRTGMKTYRGRDGKLKMYHKHPGTTGYHNPDIVHRKPENHPKGMIDVKSNYLKDEYGEWYYKK